MTDKIEADNPDYPELMPFSEWQRLFDNTLFVRHFATEMNTQGRLQGTTNPDLSVQGLEEARKFADELSGAPDKPSIVFSSSIKRASQTAAIIASALGNVRVHEIPALNELNFGEWEGKAHDELHGLVEHNLWLQNPLASAPPGGEDLVAFLRRVNSGMEKVREISNGEYGLVVAHATSIRAVRFLALLSQSGITSLNDPRIKEYGEDFFYIKQGQRKEFLQLPHGQIKFSRELELL